MRQQLLEMVRSPFTLLTLQSRVFLTQSVNPMAEIGAQSMLSSSWTLVTPDQEEKRSLMEIMGVVQDYLTEGASNAWQCGKERYTNPEVLVYLCRSHSADTQKRLEAFNEVLSTAVSSLPRII